MRQRGHPQPGEPSPGSVPLSPVAGGRGNWLGPKHLKWAQNLMWYGKFVGGKGWGLTAGEGSRIFVDNEKDSQLFGERIPRAEVKGCL